MGNAGSNETAEEREKERSDRDRSKILDAKLVDAKTAMAHVHKLLLLGAGESGKSTLFKQLIAIYGKGFTERERKEYTGVVRQNVIQSSVTLARQAVKYGTPSFELDEILREVRELKLESDLDPVLGARMKRMWNDPLVQTAYANRAHFQLTDSTAYFFERIDDVCNDNYIPTEHDVLRVRVRTTGIVETQFQVGRNTFKMFDVGGQRNERKKWIHSFENVTAVLFVAAISEYDQVCFEDDTTNRMHEALNLFDEMCNSRWFKKTAMILFLNKRDLFGEKITRVSLRECFPEYTGEDNYDQGVAFVRGQFEGKNKNFDKIVYTHVTCATDTDNVTAVFNAVKDIIIRLSLSQSGLV